MAMRDASVLLKSFVEVNVSGALATSATFELVRT